VKLVIGGRPHPAAHSYTMPRPMLPCYLPQMCVQVEAAPGSNGWEMLRVAQRKVVQAPRSDLASSLSSRLQMWQRHGSGKVRRWKPSFHTSDVSPFE
jgi:hypothetical protein